MKTVLLLIVLLAGVLQTAFAKMIEVEGSAVIQDGDRESARRTAYQNALKQASLSRDVRVYGHYSMNQRGNMTDSTQWRTASHISQAEIINESVTDNVLRLTVRADIRSASSACESGASRYRKKIAAVFFPVRHPQQILLNDYYGYERAVPVDILRRLASTDNFLTIDASEMRLYADIQQSPYIDGLINGKQSVLRELADSKNVQFVISGVIRDVSLDYSKGLLASWFTSDSKPAKRNLEIEFFVHDALSGELLARHLHARTAVGDGLLPERHTPVATRSFYKTAFGQQLDSILRDEVEAIDSLLSCRPFTVKVLKQVGRKIYLDAGYDTGIKADDTLTVYRSDGSGEVFGIRGEMEQFGHPGGIIRIKQVFPGYAVAEAESGKALPDIAAGSWLQAR